METNKKLIDVGEMMETRGGTDITVSPYGDLQDLHHRTSGTKRVKSFYSLQHEEILKHVNDIIVASTEDNIAVYLSSMVANMTNKIVTVGAFLRQSVHLPTFVAALRSTAKLGAGFYVGDFFQVCRFSWRKGV